MKAYIILIVGVAFIVFFRENPLGAVVILGVLGGAYFLYKSKSHARRSTGNGLFGGRGHDYQEEELRILTFLALSKLLNDSTKVDIDLISNTANESRDENKDFHEMAKNDILRLFEG
ncbi:MAG: hypothetical protein JW891_08120 [Candidatus Lokiarchaeota archaeon]|nr:hypothetical protein [Candidatus Lokiarchaeota archaeon]